MSTEAELRAMIDQYFSGLHRGDVDSLSTLFHADCVLKAPGLRRGLTEWLANVSARPAPHATGHAWDYGIIRLELEGDQAMAKVSCPLPHGHFIDYLGFLREGGAWKIANKMYALKAGAENENAEN